MAKLPSGYTQLEYIESTGTQRIDTGIVPKNSLTIVVDFSISNITSRHNIIGYRTLDKSNNISGFVNSGGIGYIDFNNSITTYTRTSYTGLIANTRYAYYISSGVRKILEGDNILTQNTYECTDTFNTSNTMGLFTIKGNPNIDQPLIGKIYSFYIKDGTNYVENFIPAKRNSDGVIGMYDLSNDGSNLFDKSVATHGTIAAATGKVDTTCLYRVSTDLISVNAGDTLSFAGSVWKEGSSTEYNCQFIKAFYDSDKNFISGSRSTTSSPITVPEGAAYIRFEFYQAGISSGSVMDLNNIKVTIVKGSTTPTEYIPFPFYTNSGTGVFIAGPEVTPPKVIIHGSVGTRKAIAPYSPYEWLEWIESTGTQYIDTLISGYKNTYTFSIPE